MNNENTSAPQTNMKTIEVIHEDLAMIHSALKAQPEAPQLSEKHEQIRGCLQEMAAGVKDLKKLILGE